MARSRKPRPPIEVTLETFAFTGEAVGESGTRPIHAWGGLPGERVQVRERKRKGGRTYGVVEEVFEASPDRVLPEEDHFVCCSPWQVLAPSAEPGVKAELVRKRFRDVYGIDLPEFEVEGEVRTGYRNKLEFGFVTLDDGPSLSFFERGGPGRRIAIAGCCLGHPAINTAAAKIVERLRQVDLPQRVLKSLMLRSNLAGEVVAGLYVREPIPECITALAGLEPLVGFRIYASNPKSPASVVDEVLLDLGRNEIRETVLGREFGFSDRSFFQVNVERFEQALRAMQRHVLPDLPVYDLYAGVGTIGICLGGPGLHFVEIEPEFARRLEENVRAHGLEDARIMNLPAEKAIESLPRESTVIVDPPRVGLHPKVVARLAEFQPRRIIYLSCNPDTQARDWAVLKDAYRCLDFRAFNFFPRTPHLETLAVLERHAVV